MSKGICGIRICDGKIFTKLQNPLYVTIDSLDHLRRGSATHCFVSEMLKWISGLLQRCCHWRIFNNILRKCFLGKVKSKLILPLD